MLDLKSDDAPVSVEPRRRRRRGIAILVATVGVLAAAGALSWHPWAAGRRFERALSALAARQFDLVRRELAALEGVNGFEPHRHFLRGALLLGQRQYYPALEEFGHCVDHPELRVRTLILSGQALYQAKRFRDAMGLLVQAVDADPQAADAYWCLAAAYDDLGLLGEALQAWSRVAELWPADPRPHRMMGLRCKDFERWESAVEMYQESLRRGPDQADRDQILLEMAECQIKLRRTEEALATLASCVPSPERWTKEAECHMSAGRTEEARRLLDQTLRHAPADLSGLLLKGTLDLQEGRSAEAVESFRRAAIAYPKEYVAHYKLSQAYRRLGKEAEAKKHADLAEQLRQLRMEFSRLHTTAAAEPDNADVRCRIGVLAKQLDRSDLARGWFEAALSINPRHPEAIRHLTGQPVVAPKP